MCRKGAGQLCFDVNFIFHFWHTSKKFFQNVLKAKFDAKRWKLLKQSNKSRLSCILLELFFLTCDSPPPFSERTKICLQVNLFACSSSILISRCVQSWWKSVAFKESFLYLFFKEFLSPAEELLFPRRILAS